MGFDRVAVRWAELIPPGKATPRGSPRRGFPLRLGRKPISSAGLGAEPGTIRSGLEPTDAHDRLPWLVEVAVGPKARAGLAATGIQLIEMRIQLRLRHTNSGMPERVVLIGQGADGVRGVDLIWMGAELLDSHPYIEFCPFGRPFAPPPGPRGLGVPPARVIVAPRGDEKRSFVIRHREPADVEGLQFDRVLWRLFGVQALVAADDV